MNVLVTGVAGFIGAHLARRLLAAGDTVTGVDSLDAYYSPRLKRDRLEALCRAGAAKNRDVFVFREVDICDRGLMAEVFRRRFDVVFHMAAQAGVRYSLQNPDAYIRSNINGFHCILELCRRHGAGHLVYASSSSVYGANRGLPFSTGDNADRPLSLYAATKKSNELQAHAYAHLYGLPCTGLRFFTIYGPWGRPDMAYYSFARDILEGRPIQVFNRGDMQRDLTYIEDVVECLARIGGAPPRPDAGWDGAAPDPASGSSAPYRLYNIGSGVPVPLPRLIECLESLLGRKAVLEMREMPPGDVPSTCADTAGLRRDFGFAPRTPMEEGLKKFTAWFLGYH